MKQILLILLTLFVIVACDNSSDKKSIDSTLTSNQIDSKIDSTDIFKPLNSVQTIKIGNQVWMTEDIKITSYNNGDPIYEAKQEKQWKDCGDKKIGCYRKLNNGTFLYNGFAVNDKRGILPSGFILPKYEQFNQLIKFLGGGSTQGGKAVRSLATYSLYLELGVPGGGLEGFEIRPNGKSGFKAKEGGFIYDNGTLTERGCSFWWTSSTEGDGLGEFDIGQCGNDLGGGSSSEPSTFGFAVRPILLSKIESSKIELKINQEKLNESKTKYAPTKVEPQKPESVKRSVEEGSIMKKGGAGSGGGAKSNSSSNGTIGTRDGVGGNNNGDGKKGEVGDKGDPRGTPDGMSMMGKPGKGSGSGVAIGGLSGWNKRKLSLPDDGSSEAGKIVFKVTVDDSGDVVGISVVSSTVSPSVQNFYKNYIQQKLGSVLSPAGTPPPRATGTITINI